jgi:hypothetical protein
MHLLSPGPADKEAQMPGGRRVAAHPAVVKAQEVQALPALAQLHDPRLSILGREAVPGEDCPQCSRARSAYSRLWHITTR